MDNCDYVLDGDLAFSNTSAALKFYQTEYHKQKDRIKELEQELLYTKTMQGINFK